MILSLSLDRVLQLLAWGIAQIEVVLALYVLLLNLWHTSNRYIAVMFFLFAVDNIAVGAMMGAENVEQARWAAVVIAATAPAIQPAVLLGTMALLRPELLRRRWRWLLRLVPLIPLLLTLADISFGMGLWYTGLDEATYDGGFVPLTEYASGSLAPVVRVIIFYLMSSVSTLFALYVALNDRSLPTARRMGWVLSLGSLALMIVNILMRRYFYSGLISIVSSVFFVLIYGYAAFHQLISERRVQQGQLSIRLPSLVLAIIVPLFVATTYFFTFRARMALRHLVVEQLRIANHSLGTNASTWIEFNIGALNHLVSIPDIVSMDPARQEPVLKAMATVYPHMYLVSTTDLNGINVARSDGRPPKDYHDRKWFQGAVQGRLTFQTLIGRTSGEPALVAAMPIKDDSGRIVGVGMFATDLTDMVAEVRAGRVGDTGISYLVDGENKVIAHPDPAYSNELRDLGDYPPVVALRNGRRGEFFFTDAAGKRWWGYLDVVADPYGADWGVIVQQEESEWIAGMRRFLLTIWVMAGMDVFVFGVLIFMAVRQAFMPLHSLMETARAISAGDLERVAPVESDDEIGMLARTFNQMTKRLREAISNLEERVQERTAELERRTRYLEASAQVARDATSLLDPQSLLDRVARLIGEQFGFYHIALFLVDESGEWLVLQAVFGEAGQELLQAGYRVSVNQGEMGYVATGGGPRALRSPARPEFRTTRSELLLPLRARGEIMGVLDIHSTEEGAFDDDDIAILQSLADQVALALSNARLFQQAQQALEAERRAYGEFIAQEWAEMLRERTVLGYICDTVGVRPVEEYRQAGDESGELLPELTLPVVVRGRAVGSIRAHKPAAAGEWTEDEIRLMKTLVEQVGVALEGAQLYRDTRLRAARERLIGEVTGSLRESLNIETVARRAVRELVRALGMDSVTLYLGPADRTGTDDE